MAEMTWNMQGAGTGQRPSAKWEALADYLVGSQDPPAVVSLQECGTVPDRLPYYWEHVKTLDGNGWDVEVYRWQAQDDTQTSYLECYVSYVYLDVGAHRVNLAVVTLDEPEDAATTFAERRPALGITTEEDDPWTFSVHASAAGGWDAADVMANIYTTVRCGWRALGDWNTRPASVAWNGEDLAQLTEDCGLHHVEPNQPTHPRIPSPSSPPRVLDWAVHTDGVGLGPATRLDMGLSDHYAVLFA